MRSASGNMELFWLTTVLVLSLPLVTYIPFIFAINIPLSAFFIFICLTSFFQLRCRPLIVYYLVSFCAVYTVYALFSENVPNANNSHFGMLNWTLKVQLAFIPAFYFARRKVLTRKRIQLVCYLFFAASFLAFYINQENLLNRMEIDDVTNNVGYLFVSVIPLMFFNFKKNL